MKCTLKHKKNSARYGAWFGTRCNVLIKTKHRATRRSSLQSHSKRTATEINEEVEYKAVSHDLNFTKEGEKSSFESHRQTFIDFFLQIIRNLVAV